MLGFDVPFETICHSEATPLNKTDSATKLFDGFVVIHLFNDGFLVGLTFLL